MREPQNVLCSFSLSVGRSEIYSRSGVSCWEKKEFAEASSRTVRGGVADRGEESKAKEMSSIMKRQGMRMLVWTTRDPISAWHE